MIRSVVKKGDVRLVQPSIEVENPADYADLIADMHDTLDSIRELYEFKRGHGIAAVQVGVNVRINIVEYDGQSYTLINPIMFSHNELKPPRREGCLSFFSYRGQVPRYTQVTISYTDENGDPQTLNAEEDFAALIQHELDHLDGIIYVDHIGEDALVLHNEMPAIP
jgi:peptide deformylase